MSLDNRIAEIKSSVDEFLRRINQWLQDSNGTAMMPDGVKSALSIAHLTCGGDIPECCRTLAVVAVPRLVEEMRKFSTLEQDCYIKVGNVPSPMPRFWAAVKALHEAREGAEELTFERMEPVNVLRKQGVSDDQIGKNIYGHRVANSMEIEGPFMLRNGTVDIEKLDRQCEWEKQVREGGTITAQPVVPANWIPPWYKTDNQQRRDELQKERDVYERIGNPKRYEDPATVEELLQDGCFIQQIEKVKTVNGKPITRDQILEIAHRLKLEAKDAPGSGYRASQVIPEITGDDEGDPEDDDATATPDKTALRDLIIETYLKSAGTKGAPEIAQELKLAGNDVRSQQVATTIQHYKARAKKEKEAAMATAGATT